MTVFRYPIRPPVIANGSGSDATRATDFAVFRRVRTEYKDSTKTYYGRNVPGSTPKVKKNDNTVALAMPNNVQANYSVSYKKVDPGLAGMAAADLMNSDMDAKTMADSLAGFAKGALPEFQFKAIAEIANNLNNVVGTGGNLDANSLLALTKGQVFNPFSEQIFDSVAFRKHNFNFKLVARDPAEAKVIKYIIDYFKIGAHPVLNSLGGSESDGVFTGTSAASQYRFLSVPDLFEIEFRRVRVGDSEYSTGNTKKLHFKIDTSVCTNVNVNYVPDGKYTSFKKIEGSKKEIEQLNVPAVNLQLQFTETRLLNQRDIAEGY